MPKLPTCNCCLYCAHDSHLVCAVHPTGVESDTCSDFRLEPELVGKQYENFLGLQEPTASLDTYEGEHLSVQPSQRQTAAEQLQLLQTHPLFTGVCPACGVPREKDFRTAVDWDCECGWTDDLL